MRSWSITSSPPISTEQSYRECRQPNIVHVLGLSKIKNRIAIVMDFMHGDLYELLIGNSTKILKSTSLFQRLGMAKDAALGLNWLHEREPAIIHR